MIGWGEHAQLTHMQVRVGHHTVPEIVVAWLLPPLPVLVGFISGPRLKAGGQIQVSGVVERKVFERFGPAPVRLRGSARTDQSSLYRSMVMPGPPTLAGA
jgi:hypothetical protein